MPKGSRQTAAGSAGTLWVPDRAAVAIYGLWNSPGAGIEQILVIEAHYSQFLQNIW